MKCYCNYESWVAVGRGIFQCAVPEFFGDACPNDEKHSRDLNRVPPQWKSPAQSCSLSYTCALWADSTLSSNIKTVADVGKSEILCAVLLISALPARATGTCSEQVDIQNKRTFDQSLQLCNACFQYDKPHCCQESETIHWVLNALLVLCNGCNEWEACLGVKCWLGENYIIVVREY